MNRTAIIALLGASFALPPWALAQPARELQAAPVVITATRVEESSFDLPVSIDAVDAATIRSGQPQVNLSESLLRVPGLVVQNRQNYAQDLQVSSRGFGARSAFGVRGVRLIADGIPATMPDGQGQAATFNLSSASRIEVMRGPFSALYGNAAGGVVQIFTEDGPAQPTLEASALAGSYGTAKAGAKAGGQAGSLNYVLDLSRFDTEGYRDHSAATRDHLNAKLKYALDAASSLTLVVNALDQPDTQDPLGLTLAQWQDNPRQAAPQALTFNTRKSIRHAQGGLVYERQLGAADSLRLMGYFGNRQVEQFQSIPVAVQAPVTHPGGVIDFDRDFGGASVRWTRKGALAGGPLTVTVGIDYDLADERRLGFENFVGTTLGVKGALRRDEDDRVHNLDEYVQAQWQPAERWRLSAGLRHSVVRFESKDRFVVGANPDDSGAVRFASTNPVAGLLYQASPSVNLYVNAGRGFETPSFNELFYKPDGSPGLNFALQPARSRHYEAGVKAFLGAGTRLNLALFRVDTRNEIVVAGSSGGRTTFRNAGETERRGVELALDSDLGRGFNAYFAYTGLEAKFRGDALDGKTLPGVPAATAYGELAWKHASGFSTALEARASDKVQVVDTNAQPAAPGYTVANWRAVYERRLDGVTLTGFLRVDNLFDKKYVGSVIVGETNARFYEPAPGRSFMAGIGARVQF